MSIKWILVAVAVTYVISRCGRKGGADRTSSWWGPLIMFGCFAFAFMFLFMGNSGPKGEGNFRTPKLSYLQLPEMPSLPRPAVQAHAPQANEEASHKHGISKSAFAIVALEANAESLARRQ